jgi:hypothetical protein
MLVMHTDADAAVAEIGLIVALAQQCDSLGGPHEATRLRAEISVRIRALQMVLWEDEAQIRKQGFGGNVPLALAEIERARSALQALERAVDDRWCA